VVNSKGSIKRIGTTTNGTVRSSGASVTFPVTLFGFVVTATCATSNTDLCTSQEMLPAPTHIDGNATGAALSGPRR
jgi:hypothetical protein